MADHIVSRTPPMSYRSRDHLEMVILERNFKKIGDVACGMLSKMVEKRLIERDGLAFNMLKTG